MPGVLGKLWFNYRVTSNCLKSVFTRSGLSSAHKSNLGFSIFRDQSPWRRRVRYDKDPTHLILQILCLSPTARWDSLLSTFKKLEHWSVHKLNLRLLIINANKHYCHGDSQTDWNRRIVENIEKVISIHISHTPIFYVYIYNNWCFRRPRTVMCLCGTEKDCRSSAAWKKHNK